MPTVNEIEESVRGRRFVVAFLDLPEAYVIDDEELGGGPALEPARVGTVGETGVEVVEQVDAAGVSHAELTLTGLDAERLQDMALAGSALAGEEQVLGASDEVEAGNLEDHGLVEAWLKGPVEGLEGLALGEAGELDSALDATLAFLAGLGAEDTLEEGADRRLVLEGPGQVLVEVFEGMGQT